MFFIFVVIPLSCVIYVLFSNTWQIIADKEDSKPKQYFQQKRYLEIKDNKKSMLEEARQEALAVINKTKNNKPLMIKRMVESRINTYCSITLMTNKIVTGYIYECNDLCLRMRLAFDEERDMPFMTIFYDSILAIS